MANEALTPPGQTRYVLPDGGVVFAKKPTNAIRRLLIEQPDTNLRFLMEVVAAACMVRMELPENYNEGEEPPVARDFEFYNANSKDKNLWTRLDELSILDNQAYVEAFQEQNLPTRAMVDAILDGIKKAKSAAKSEAEGK